MSERMVKTKEASEICGISPATMWRKSKEGSFPKPYQLGINSIAYKLSELVAWMETLNAVNVGHSDNKIAYANRKAASDAA